MSDPTKNVYHVTIDVYGEWEDEIEADDEDDAAEIARTAFSASDADLDLGTPHVKLLRAAVDPDLDGAEEQYPSALDEAIRMFTGAWPARRQVFAS